MNDKYHTIHLQTLDQHYRFSNTCVVLRFIALNVFVEETFAYAVTNIFSAITHILDNVEKAPVCYRLFHMPLKLKRSNQEETKPTGCQL